MIYKSDLLSIKSLTLNGSREKGLFLPYFSCSHNFCNEDEFNQMRHLWRVEEKIADRFTLADLFKKINLKRVHSEVPVLMGLKELWMHARMLFRKHSQINRKLHYLHK